MPCCPFDFHDFFAVFVDFPCLPWLEVEWVDAECVECLACVEWLDFVVLDVDFTVEAGCLCLWVVASATAEEEIASSAIDKIASWADKFLTASKQHLSRGPGYISGMRVRVRRFANC